MISVIGRTHLPGVYKKNLYLFFQTEFKYGPNYIVMPISESTENKSQNLYRQYEITLMNKG